MSETVLHLKNITKVFGQSANAIEKHLPWGAEDTIVRALDGVSLSVDRGEVVALVGESGCGKSTLGRIAAGVLQQTGGSVEVEGQDLSTLGRDQCDALLLKVQMVFQNPRDSLNPRHTIRRIVTEPAIRHGISDRRNVDEFTADLLADVGIQEAFKNRKPHELSGGQCQRIGVARALSVNPTILVCDEPVSALDVSIQAQVLNLFIKLKKQRELSYLFISHDLHVVEHLSDRVVVMYLGRVVEEAPTGSMFAAPAHPYTRALLDSVPRIDQRRRKFQSIQGEIASPLSPPTGCHFHPRCPHADEQCRSERPPLRVLRQGHSVACHRAEDITFDSSQLKERSPALIEGSAP